MRDGPGLAARPAWLEGAWRREGRAFGPGPLEEISRVLWLQAGGYFADLRVPTHPAGPNLSHLDVAQAFSGSVRQEGSTLTWRHDLDTLRRPAGYEDTAEVEWRGSVLLERGPHHVEVWRREVDPACIAAVERRAAATSSVTARIVLVADLFVAVWGGRDPGGAVLRFEDGGWEIEAQVGEGPIPWAAVLAVRSGDLPAGWEKVA
jgi:hypothetical protein